MIQVVIHYDNGIKEIAAQGSWDELMSQIPNIIAQIDPDAALWEFKEVKQPHSLELAAKHVADQMGVQQQ